MLDKMQLSWRRYQGTFNLQRLDFRGRRAPLPLRPNTSGGSGAVLLELSARIQTEEPLAAAWRGYVPQTTTIKVRPRCCMQSPDLDTSRSRRNDLSPYPATQQADFPLTDNGTKLQRN